MIRFVLKTLVRGLLILLLLPLLIVLLLATEPVNRWLIGQIPKVESRLELHFVQGHLWRGWQFEQVVWRDEGITVTIDELDFAWSPNCLFGMRLCVDRLDIERISVEAEPNDEVSERERIELPSIRLPLGIQVDQLRVGSLWLNTEEPLLTDIQLAAHMSGNHLVIHRFSGQGPELDWQLDGDVRMSGDWPLRIQTQVNLPPMEEQSWALDVRLGGSAAMLEVDARSRGYLTGRLNGQVSPLEPEVPLALTWHGESFLALNDLPPTLTVNDLQLDVRGDLDQGFAVQGNAGMPGEGGDISVELSADAGLEGVSDLVLELFVTAEPQRRLRLAGDLNWQEQLEADATLQMQRFPWQWLYPQDIGSIVLEQLDLEARLRGDQIYSDLSAQLTGVADQQVDLALTLEGTQEALRIAPLSLETAAGKATGQVMLELGERIAWELSLLLEELDPGVFVADLPGSLNGPVSSSGSLVGEQLTVTANWDLQGSLRSQPLQLAGALDKQDEAWLISDLLLRQGENRITGAGRWGEQIAADIDIQLPRLNTLWPGLSGTLEGSLVGSGSQAQPVLDLALQGSRLGYEELSINSLEATGQVTLSETLPMRLNLTTQRMRNGEIRLGNLDLQLNGNRQRHTLALQLDRGIVDVDLTVAGQLHDDRWQGQLSSASLAYEELDWRLRDTAGITYRFDPAQLRLGAHCWAQQGAQLCFNGEQRLLPDRQLDLSLSNFSLETLDGVLPDDFSWNAVLNADVTFSQSVGGDPVADINISSLDGVINVTNPDQTLAFPYERLELTTRLQANRAVSRLVLSSEGLGTLDVRANVDDPGGEQTLEGEYRIEGLKLDILRPFLAQVETLRGQMNGQGRLTGSLTEPQVDGELLLEDGHLSGPELPISLEQLSLRVAIAGQGARIDGQWRSGDEGQGSLEGNVTWAPELDLELLLKGQSLPVTVAPYADLRVSPDLSISLAENRLQVRGQIAVPEGDIIIRDLPEQAVRLSSDVVIVGEEPDEENPPLDISARVQLVIGDQLRFSGFGLTGRLRGQIEVEENLNATGDLNVLDGQYRGYGQRLTLRRAQILFAGPITQPFLNIEAIRRIDDVVAGLRLTGRAEAPQSEVFSEPGMPQEQALSYLILGRPLGGEGGDSNMLGQAALAMGLAGSAPLAGNIASSLGIDGFALEAEGSGLTTQVVAAGYLTDKLSLRYGVGVFEPANQLALRYELTRRLYLEAVTGFASSLDFFYRIDF